MSRITLLPAAERQARPWKNGGGTTTDIALHPVGAGMEDFEWRLSMASVAERGPFSHFAGVDRILAVIEGRLELAFDSDARMVALAPDSPPHPFPGEARVIGTPLGGTVVDLNLMTRRGRWAGKMDRVALSHSHTLASAVAVLVFMAEARLRCGAEIVPVQPLDAIRIEAAEGQSVPIEGAGDAWVIGLTPVGH